MKNMLILIVFFILSACTGHSIKEQELNENLNKTLLLDFFDIVHNGGEIISFDQLRNNFKYISVVYLQDGCNSCYPKFIEWQKKIESISVPDNYTLLFIIQGKSYEDFMSEVLKIDFVEDKYYVIMDPDHMYLQTNKSIPQWIIDSSLLIDSESKIKMVGKPWINRDMTRLFNQICENK